MVSANRTNRCHKSPVQRQIRIAVIGDAIQDVYIHGIYNGKNPETAGRLFRVEKTVEQPGGAAAVAMLTKHLGGLSTAVRLWSKPQDQWSHKTRLVSDGVLMPDRIDIDNTEPISDLKAQQIANEVKAFRPNVILVADYCKGVITETLLNLLPKSMPMFVDPGKARPWNIYPRHAIIKANRHEAALEAKGTMGHLTTHPSSILSQLGKTRSVIITAESLGIYWMANGVAGHVPSRSVEVKDVCGAGDTVLAAIGIATAEGRGIEDACVFANHAASMQVQRLGVCPVYKEEMEPVTECLQCQ